MGNDRHSLLSPRSSVVRSALQNAASIASLLLTTGAVISLIPEGHQKAVTPMGGMDGGTF